MLSQLRGLLRHTGPKQIMGMMLNPRPQNFGLRDLAGLLFIAAIFDGMSKHAAAPRQVSPVSKRPPGREAYPGDVPYPWLQIPGAEHEDEPAALQESLSEPSPEAFLGSLPSHYLNIHICQVLLNAKAGNLIDDLTLEHNRPRRGNNTKELLEFAGGRAEPGHLGGRFKGEEHFMEAIFRYSQTQTRGHPDGLTASYRSFFARLLGCWHREMSRPFTHDGESYRACLKCGAHRRFDVEKWRMRGPYYFSRPAADAGSLHSEITHAPIPGRDSPVTNMWLE